MGLRYSAVQGLLFLKGSDREYTEVWENVSIPVVIQKTIAGRKIVSENIKGKLTISGRGDILPHCDLSPGDVLNVTLRHKPHTIPMRFDEWTYTYSPWEFSYKWSYIFSEVTS